MKRFWVLTSVIVSLLYCGVAFAVDTPSQDGIASIHDLAKWFMSGEKRLVAAGALFVLMWLAKGYIPWVKTWLATDSGKLTSKRKKLLANVVLAMTPVLVMLTSDPAPSFQDVGMMALNIALMAMGIQGGLKALFASPEAAIAQLKASVAAEDEATVKIKDAVAAEEETPAAVATDKEKADGA